MVLAGSIRHCRQMGKCHPREGGDPENLAKCTIAGFPPEFTLTKVEVGMTIG